MNREIFQLIDSLLYKHFTHVNPSQVQHVFFFDNIVTEADPFTAFRKFYEHNGWIQTENGLSLRIKDQLIVQLKIISEQLGFLKEMKKDEVLLHFGKPDKVITDQESGDIHSVRAFEILIYNDEKVYVFIDRYSFIVREFHFGELLNEPPRNGWTLKNIWSRLKRKGYR